jgi:DNA-binding LacI/PurR family transcriptional regulator
VQPFPLKSVACGNRKAMEPRRAPGATDSRLPSFCCRAVDILAHTGIFLGMKAPHAATTPKYLDLAERVLALIADRRLKDGDALPPEKRLAALFGVNHLTVRKALKHLEQRGLTHALPSCGNYVGRRPRNRHRTHLIGVLFPDAESFFYDIATELESRMAHFGLAPVICLSHGSPERERRALEFFDSVGVCGIAAAPNAACADAYRRIEVPTVFFDSRIADVTVPYVITDDFEGARHGVEHLLSLGHRLIAHIGALGDETSQQRLAGFRTALKDAGVNVPSGLIRLKEYSRQWGYYAAEQILGNRPGPTAVFCGNDTIASGVLRYLRARGIACPADVSVLGFSNSQLSADLELSSVDQPREVIAKAVWKNLQACMRGETPGLETKILTSLVVRRSTSTAAR